MLFCTIVLFSTIEVTVKQLVRYLPALCLGGLRFVATGILLLPLALVRIRARGRVWTLRDFVALVLLGFIGVTFALSFYHASLCFLPANIGAIVFSANPIFVALFAALLGDEKMRLRTISALILGSAGLALIAWNRGVWSEGWLPGIFLMTVAQAAFAYYSVLAKRFMPRFGAMTLTAFAGLVGGFLLLGLSRLIEGPTMLNMPAHAWWNFAYLVAAATALPYVLFFHGLARVGATRGAVFFFLKPLLAPLFAYIVLDETLGSTPLLGAVLIVAGLIIALLPEGQEAGPD